MARDRGCAGRPRRRAGVDRPLGPDARPRRARPARSGAAPGDPLERPAHGAECAEIEERVGLERLIELTGNRALTGFTAPKLLWLRNHEPDTYARIAHVLLPKDYVRLRLTGERAIDVADASGTLLFDVANRRWSDEVLDALELGRVAAAGARVHGDRRRRRPGGGGARRRRRPARAALGRPRHLRCRLRGAARVPADPEARLHVFCHAVPGPGTRWA